MARRRDRDFDDWRRDFFDDIFEDFDDEIKRMNERMYRIFEDMKKHEGDSQGEPYVYGFTYRLGPDGKPSFQEFGNVLPHTGRLPAGEEYGIREPITDLTEDKENVYVTFELPGVSKDKIDLKVDDKMLTIDVNEDSRKYHKEVPFQSEVNPDSVSAKFVNGILDITIKKKKETGRVGKKVSIQ